MRSRAPSYEIMRALVVEDEEALRRNVAAHLREAGFTVDEAADAYEARRRVQGQRYRVVLTDLKLPAGSGFDVLEAARVRIRGLFTKAWNKRDPLTPAKLTMPSSRSVWLATASYALWMLSLLVTSITTGITSGSCMEDRSMSSEMSAAKTFQPLATKRSTVAWPSPPPA